jgi:ABC-2 type transport system permease protein
MDDRLASPPRADPAPPAPTPPRAIGWFNGRGTWTLYVREVWRYIKLWQQTLASPIVVTLLFLAIFSLALGGAARSIGGVPFDLFLAPGLVMMAITQNAFANTSSSIMISKVQGNIVDVLMPPLAPSELTLGYTLAGVTRGVSVGIVCTAAIMAFVELSVYDWGLILYHAAMASLMFSLLGVMGGIWADKFDHIAAVANFVVTPAAFLSGTFYSIDGLPGVWNAIAHANPLFFLIDGFRAGFIAKSDASLLTGAIVVAAVNAALWTACHLMFKTGYKLKA